MVLVIACVGVIDDLAITSTPAIVPLPPPTAIIRFVGKVTLLSIVSTETGDVNAGVVIPMAPIACVVNVPELRGMPIHVAGTGGVAVE
jgi:hypothetical protein